MTDAEWAKIALNALAVVLVGVVGWYVRSSREEIRDLAKSHEEFRKEFKEKLNRVEFTLYGVNGTNGMYAEVSVFAKWRQSAHAWLASLAAQVGLELREDGTTREVPGVLLIERRLERRAGEERRRDSPDHDDSDRRHGDRRERED